MQNNALSDSLNFFKLGSNVQRAYEENPTAALGKTAAWAYQQSKGTGLEINNECGAFSWGKLLSVWLYILCYLLSEK